MSEEYSGFDLTMYNLFTLLREMYYTRGETETNFLQKSGGTITGSVTIQGNLVVNGQSYSIDTENLKVGDYTITLAKDNEQTLTSMVGMVVPKYDGTNYGFFGWDADGYAYVGDLTNYDGTSAITLANNSSLQRISTIDTTNTVVASNGVIYVYDATSHCFKKPTNDNKYYVIRNGAFVETELFTEQKSKNIDNALYNIGAFDIVSGNTITRQTGYVDLGSLSWEKTSNNRFETTLPSAIPNGDTSIPDLVFNRIFTADTPNHVYFNVAENIATLNSNKDFLIYVSSTYYANHTAEQFIADYGDIQIQYKLATSYTESIIPNAPLLTLNQDGCNFLRNEWEKGLNLLPNSKGITLLNASAYFKVNFKQGQTYTFSIQGGSGSDNYALFMADLSGNIVQTITNGTSYNSDYTFTCNVSNGVTLQLYANSITNCNIMLNEGDHAYPYQAYNGAIVHKGDIVAIDEKIEFTSSTSIAYTDKYITIPANCVYSITATFVYNLGKPLMASINYLNSADYILACVANTADRDLNALSPTVSGYSGNSSINLYFFAKYSNATINEIQVKGFYIKK